MAFSFRLARDSLLRQDNGKRTLSSAVSHSSNSSFWKTIPMFWRRKEDRLSSGKAVNSSSPANTEPLSGRIWPESKDRRVLFPEPDGPTIAMNPVAGKRRVTSCRTLSPPYDFDRCMTERKLFIAQLLHEWGLSRVREGDSNRHESQDQGNGQEKKRQEIGDPQKGRERQG